MGEPKKCNGFRGGEPCKNPTIFARGFCATCYKNFVQECKANGSWRPYDQTLHQNLAEGLKVERKTWLAEGGWAGNEKALIKIAEDQEANRGNHSDDEPRKCRTSPTPEQVDSLIRDTCHEVVGLAARTRRWNSFCK